jgi:uncharacterized protein YjiS (DUF1127 family)
MRTALYAGSQPVRHHDAGSGIAAVLTAALRRFDDWRRTRTAIRSLSNLPDSMLKDIGLTRGEIPRAVRRGRDDDIKPPRSPIG